MIVTNAELMASGHAWHLELNARERYRAVCECGYVSAFRDREVDAVRAGLHHLGILARQVKASGVSLPPGVRRAS